MRATRAIVRLDHLKNNLSAIRTHVGDGVRLCLAVKADAYGHGICEIARAASEVGVEYLAVATSDEAADLRACGIEEPILLYSLASPGEIEAIVALNVTPILADEEQATLYEAESARQGKQTTVHIKIDTGMGRIGCRPEDAAALAGRIVGSGTLRLGGTSTHFAAADSGDRAYTDRQLAMFVDSLEAIRAQGIDPGIVHAANSGGVLAHPDSHFDMVRPGILAYGYYPSDEQQRTLPLRPVMELQSRLVFIKRVAAGEAISYGMTWTAPRETWIGTVPIGYGDGYSRMLSNRAKVLIGGHRYPVVGRVCMDQLMVDLGPDLSVQRYDDVVLFGATDGAPTAEDIARWCGTIPYEITCNVSKRVARVYEA